MVVHDKGRFYFGNLSMCFPDNVEVMILPVGDRESEVILNSPDRKLSVWIKGKYICPYVPKPFRYDEPEYRKAFQTLGDVHPVIFNNVRGHYRYCTTAEENVCEYRFAMVDLKTGNNVLSIAARSDCLNKSNVSRHRVVLNLLKTLKKKKEIW